MQPSGGRGRRCARLEMIALWLLCWRLLRATAGLRRATPQLAFGNNGDESSVDPPSPLPPSDVVTMETDSTTQLAERENDDLFCFNDDDEEDTCQTEVQKGEEEEEADSEEEEEEEEVKCSYILFDNGREGKEETIQANMELGENEGEESWKEEKMKEGEDDKNVASDLLLVSDAPSSPKCNTSDSSYEPWSNLLHQTEDLNDCHLAKLTMVDSDSDSMSQEEGEEGVSSDITERVEDGLEEEEKEEERGEEEEEQQREGITGREENEERMEIRKDVPPSESSCANRTDTERQVPADFHEDQQTSNENVSTDHLDFLLARQQWKKMEEEIKNQPIPKPGASTQTSFQGTHSSLYPPTRSPRLKHREILPPVTKDPPLCSTVSPTSEDSGLDDLSFRSSVEDPETAVEKEIRLTLEREERHRKEREKISQGLSVVRPSTLQTGRSPPRPPACRTPTLSVSPIPSSSSVLSRSFYHEMTANNVIILEPDSTGSTSRNHLVSSAISGLSDRVAPSTNVIVVETSNLIIRSASEFCLSSSPVPAQTQESTFSSNPFFKLRSLSSQSLVEQEIKMVKQREDEWRRQREEVWRRGRESYDTVLVSPGLNDNITYNVLEVPHRCVSSPSSPSRTRKMDRPSLSCDHKLHPSPPQNSLAQRWEASLLANQRKQ